MSSAETAIDPTLSRSMHGPRTRYRGAFAPGGLDTFRDGHGALWAVFDTWNRPTRNARFRCCRSLQLAPIQPG